MMLSPDSNDTASPFPLTAVDRAVLAMTDEEFHPHSWDELKEIIAEHNLDVLKRWPSDLRRYMKWSSEMKAAYGSVPNFVMKERLKWKPLLSSTPLTGPKSEVKNHVPFADEADYRILINDWPYGLAPGIKHIILWLKTRLESEPTKGDMTPKSRQQVDDFIRTKFVDRVKDLQGEQEKVIWFKNWTALQSVPGMEHVHVLVRDVPEKVIMDWTDGDRPINN